MIQNLFLYFQQIDIGLNLLPGHFTLDVTDKHIADVLREDNEDVEVIKEKRDEVKEQYLRCVPREDLRRTTLRFTNYFCL